MQIHYIIKKIISEIDITFFSFLAAILGGVLSIKWHKAKSRTDAALIIAGGIATAIFLGNIVTDYFKMGPNASAGTHYIIGNIGLFIMQGIVILAKEFSVKPIETVKKIKSIRQPKENNDNDTL